MIIGLDLDGTISATLELIFELAQQVRKDCGYAPLTKTEYRRVFQTEDWHKLCVDFGIRKEDVDDYRNLLELKIKTMGPPRMIPGGKEAVSKIETHLGLDNLHFITNGHIDGIKQRFERDGLDYLLQRVSHPYEGKADTLFDIARENPGSEFVYVGDLVSDGRACRQARERGADKIKFGAITHEYAMNLPEALNDFVAENDFAFSIESIHELERIWKKECGIQL